ncbi:hypothetical protein [Nostoc sp. MG11]|nr:hypothetical protein [Nostoc sp. MG11]
MSTTGFSRRRCAIAYAFSGINPIAFILQIYLLILRLVGDIDHVD